jgi:uncharacterized protein (UPF0332 family)
MITDKEIKIIESNVRNYEREGYFKKGNYKHLTEFYLKNARKTFQTADVLLQVSENVDIKKMLGLLDDFETYLWVVTSSYYSMFYMVNALLSEKGYKLGDKIVHKVASDVFYFYFVKNNKIERYLFDIYEEAKGDALDLINYSEQAQKLFSDLENER